MERKKAKYESDKKRRQKEIQEVMQSGESLKSSKEAVAQDDSYYYSTERKLLEDKKLKEQSKKADEEARIQEAIKAEYSRMQGEADAEEALTAEQKAEKKKFQPIQGNLPIVGNIGGGAAGKIQEAIATGKVETSQGDIEPGTLIKAGGIVGAGAGIASAVASGIGLGTIASGGFLASSLSLLGGKNIIRGMIFGDQEVASLKDQISKRNDQMAKVLELTEAETPGYNYVQAEEMIDQLDRQIRENERALKNIELSGKKLKDSQSENLLDTEIENQKLKVKLVRMNLAEIKVRGNYLKQKSVIQE